MYLVRNNYKYASEEGRSLGRRKSVKTRKKNFPSEKTGNRQTATPKTGNISILLSKGR